MAKPRVIATKNATSARPSIPCPTCESPAFRRMYEGVPVDQCSRCGGVWLDENELGVIIAARDEKFTIEQRLNTIDLKGKDQPKSRWGRCPKCRKPLQRFQYAGNTGIFLDRCPSEHGIWFDSGELERVQMTIEESERRHGKKPARKTVKKDTSIKRCPRDGEPLWAIRYESETIDVCLKCGGAWCDAGELERVVGVRELQFAASAHPDIQADESKTRASRERELLSDLNCVFCEGPLQPVNYSYNSGVLLDRCAQGHGIWLDCEELERVQVFIERWGEQKPQLQRKYAHLLERARAQARSARKKNLESIEVSRFGFLNRFMRRLMSKA